MSLPIAPTADAAPDRLTRLFLRRVVDFFLLPPDPTGATTAADERWLPPVVGHDEAPAVSTGPARFLGSAAKDADDDEAPVAGSVRAAIVLGAADTAPPVAAALANTLASGKAPLVGCWSPGPDADSETSADTGDTPNPPALPGARRLAATLTAGGVPAVGRGRLAWATLPPEPEHATAGWTTACAHAADDRAAVLAIAGPRPEAFGDLIAAQDLIVLVVRHDDEGLATLARAALADAGAAAVIVPPLTGAARLLALAGFRRLHLPLHEPASRAALAGVESA